MPEFSEAEELNEELSEESDRSEEDDNNDIISGHLITTATITQVFPVAGDSLRNRQLTIARGERGHPAGAGTTDGLGGGWAGADYRYFCVHYFQFN